MLTEEQITQVWQNRLEAEVRSFYFGELTSIYSLQKQWITGLSFFLASGAAATLAAKLPSWVPLTLSIPVALMNAYSMAVRLDAKVATMAKLFKEWGQIAIDYGHLWNQTWTDDATERFSEIEQRELDLSSRSAAEAPYNPKRLSKWQKQVFLIHGLEYA